MENLGTLLGYGGVPGIIIIILVVALMAAVVIVRTTKGRVPKYEHKKETQRDNGETKAQSQDHTTAGEGFTEPGGTEKKVKSVLGTGDCNCMAIRWPNVIDYTTMPEPIGETYQLSNGLGSIVIEDEKGALEDYDPRQLPIDIKSSPERAWFATHWDIVKKVYCVSLEWWKSKAMWFAFGMMMIVFITGLVVMGE